MPDARFCGLGQSGLCWGVLVLLRCGVACLNGGVPAEPKERHSSRPKRKKVVPTNGIVNEQLTTPHCSSTANDTASQQQSHSSQQQHQHDPTQALFSPHLSSQPYPPSCASITFQTTRAKNHTTFERLRVRELLTGQLRKNRKQKVDSPVQKLPPHVSTV